MKEYQTGYKRYNALLKAGRPVDEELAAFLKDWAEKHPTEPRVAMDAGTGARTADRTTAP